MSVFRTDSIPIAEADVRPRCKSVPPPDPPSLDESSASGSVSRGSPDHMRFEPTDDESKVSLATTLSDATFEDPITPFETLPYDVTHDSDNYQVIFTGEPLYPQQGISITEGYLPFEQLPLAFYGEHQVSAMTTRYEFTRAFNEKTDGTKAKGKFYARIKRQRNDEWGPLGAPHISWPNVPGRRKFVDVTWRHLNELQDSHLVTLSFQGHALRLHSKGPPIPRNHLIINMRNMPVDGSRYLWGRRLYDLLKACPEVSVISIWALQEACPSLDIPPRFVQEIIAHISFSTPPNIFPYHLVESLPGFCRLNGEEAVLKYRGRFPHCTFCGARAIERHEEPECPRRR